MNNLLMPLFLALAAPLVYGLLGIAVLGTGRGGRVWLLPLAGGVVAGGLGELSLMTGVPFAFCLGAGLALGLARGLRGRWEEGWRVPAGVFGLLYAGALTALSFDPYPGMFLWGGDWLETLAMAHAVLAGNLPPELLSRPPLYGGMTALALLVGGGLPGAQIVSVYAAAAGLLALGPVLRLPGRGAFGRGAAMGALLVLSSPFFLLHAINLWSKLLAAGCVVAAVREGWQAAGRPGGRPFLPAALWLAAGVAVHQSSVLFAPLLLVVAGRRDPGMGFGRALAARTLVLAGAGLAVAAPFEFWVLARHGLGAVAAGNPAVTFRDGTPFWLNTVLVGISTFTGWFPLAVVNKARQGVGNPAAIAFLALAGWVVTLAGTLLGAALPALVAGGRQGLRAFGGFLRARVRVGECRLGPLIAALLAAVLGNALLNPYASPYGSVQTGLTPLCLLGLLILLAASAAGGPGMPAPGRVALVSALLGALPLLGAAAVVLIGLRLPTPAAPRLHELLIRTDADYAVFCERDYRSFALATFPVGTLLFGGLAAGFIRWLGRVGPEA